MVVHCVKCGTNMNYTEGSGHLWEALCPSCGHSETGTFSPPPPEDPDATKKVRCHLQLRDTRDIIKLRQLLPELSDKTSSELLHKLKSSGLRWDLGIRPMSEARKYERLAAKLQFEFFIEF